MTKKKRVSIIIIAILLVVVILGIAVSVFFLGAPAHDDIIMIGHRGYSSKYVDNTKESFIQAAKHGSKGVETDVRYTLDGVYVLSHDSEVKFSDGTTAEVSTSNYADLIKKPLKNTKTDEDTYLCTLDEYLNVCKEYDMICFIELKGEYNRDQIKAVFEHIQEIYSLDKCELQSFDIEVLKTAQELFPELHFMLTWSLVDGSYEECFEYGFDIDAQYTGLSKSMMEEFHSRGLKVAIWTCNDPFALYYGYWFNVDYIESDVY